MDHENPTEGASSDEVDRDKIVELKIYQAITTAAAQKRPERPWPAEQVERWAIDRLVPYANNARTHTDADVDALVASIREWGWTSAVLVGEDGRIIAGHLRVLAARKLGLTVVPVMVARGWTEAQKRAYCIADNQLASRASWDPDLLRIELGELKIDEFDLELLGFDPDQLSALLGSLGTPGLTDPDIAPEAPREPVSRRGDTWILGPHRVRCGDSTQAADVAVLLAGAKPHLMVADPPYGVSYDPTWRESEHLGVGGRSKGKVLNDDRADWREAWALFPGDVAYVWHGALHGGVVADGLRACGFVIRAQIVWAKQHFTISRGDFHWQHETCWYAVREGGTSHWAGDRRQSTLWEIPNNNAFGNQNREETWGHGTQKPVECVRRPIVNNSRPGEAVYDPFAGAGTVLIAAQMTGRVCFGMELNPAYVDVIVRRWQAFTGRQADLEATGQSFDDRAVEKGVRVDG
jgi:DNA modification methylase